MFSTFSDDVDAEEQSDFDGDPLLPFELTLSDSRSDPTPISGAESESVLPTFCAVDEVPLS